MPFKFTGTSISGLMLIVPSKYPDERGFFMETFKESEFKAAGITSRFVQDNHSFSTKGVLRGIHFQRKPFSQGKLVRVIDGRVFEVAVDLRPDSRTFKEWVGVELDSVSGKMLYLPPGFGHGFIVLSDSVHSLYKLTAEYRTGAEGGIRWDDPDLAINWPRGDVFLSDKDKRLPMLAEISEKDFG